MWMYIFLLGRTWKYQVCDCSTKLLDILEGAGADRLASVQFDIKIAWRIALTLTAEIVVYDHVI